MILKDWARKTLNFLHLDLTKNLKYDRLTKRVIDKVVSAGSTCVDVGCHKGEILDLFLEKSPNGNHFCFEPLPHLNQQLQLKYGKTNRIFSCALSEVEGKTTFNYVKNAPAYSGIKQRRYDIENPQIEVIDVELKTLDSIVGNNEKIDLIKIDVEGAELGVLKGAKNLLLRCKPVVVFECGIGASEFYGTKPEAMFAFFSQEVGMHVSLLNRFLANEKPLTQDEFVYAFENNTDYYFIAYAS
ncbi:MAG: FkbM family methyltransferase [Flavobacteriales bacterium]